MPRLDHRTSLLLVVLGLAVAGVWRLTQSPAESLLVPSAARAEEKEEDRAGETVRLILTIEDEASGLSVKVDRRVKRGTTLLAAMRETVVVETKEYPELGHFVTRLCSVAPPEGAFWQPSIDGKPATKGAMLIQLDSDMNVAWKTQQPK